MFDFIIILSFLGIFLVLYNQASLLDRLRQNLESLEKIESNDFNILSIRLANYFNIVKANFRKRKIGPVKKTGRLTRKDVKRIVKSVVEKKSN